MFPLLVLLFLTLYYLGAILFLYRGLSALRPSGEPANLTYSVVIAARNEEANIGRCLDSVFAQTMPPHRFEVIVVNDRSSDDTARICAEYRERYPNLSLITVTETPPGVAPKKHAIATGISAAHHNIIVQTDADCLVGPEWLETIDRNFGDATGLVQGITTYARPDGMNALFFGFQAVDFLSHGVVAAAAIGARMPINSNANNFAFRKQAFKAVGGYGSGVARVVSGDDDLLLQRIAHSKKWKVVFMTDPKGAVTTAPTGTIAGVFEQRKRWGSKTVKYTAAQIIFLSGIFMFYCVMAVSFGAGFFDHVYFAAFAGMLTVKICGELLMMIPGTALFRQKQLRPYIIPASLVQLVMVLAAVFFGVFGRFSWKGERFKREVK